MFQLDKLDIYKTNSIAVVYDFQNIIKYLNINKLCT